MRILRKTQASPDITTPGGIGLQEQVRAGQYWVFVTHFDKIRGAIGRGERGPVLIFDNKAAIHWFREMDPLTLRYSP